MTVSGALLPVLAAVLICGYYLGGVRIWRPWIDALARLTAALSTVTYADWLSFCRLLAAVVLQAAFFALLLALLPVDLGSLFPGVPPAPDLIRSILLGIGLLGVGATMCQTILQAAMHLVPHPEFSRSDDWSMLTQSGWMAEFRRTSRALGKPACFVLSAAYIAVEETIFRGVVLQSASGYGPTAAVALSVALFLVAQCTVTVNWRAAIFPLTGAGVLGLVHGVLAVNGVPLALLIVSHIVMFAIPMLVDYGRSP